MRTIRPATVPLSVIVLVALIALAGVIGWVSNLIKLFTVGLDPLTLLVGLRLLGVVFPPLGVILGYL